MGTGRRHGWSGLVWAVALFAATWWLPIDAPRFRQGLMESLHLARWYAREHVILCLLPAFFIAGAMSVFVSQASVMRYLGARASKVVAFGVASISGGVLAVCSCTVLPLFAGIHRMGAGIGPATAFLYSGPAINVLAIILTARVLGPELGLARAIGAVVFSIVIGLSMQLIFRGEDGEAAPAGMVMPEEATGRPPWQDALYFASMVGILVVANWAGDVDGHGVWRLVADFKWPLTAGLAVLLGVVLVTWFGCPLRPVLVTAAVVTVAALAVPSRPLVAFVAGLAGLAITLARRTGELGDWYDATRGFARQIIPLLAIGVLLAGALLGRPGEEGWIPSSWVRAAVGGDGIGATVLASVVGAFMYFATLTEIPILEGLIGNGMGKGPALALLLAGPALSLPNMLVIRSIIGTRRTAVYVVLVIIASTLGGLIYGAL